MKNVAFSTLFLVCLAVGPAAAQTTASAITSSYPTTVKTIGSNNFFSVTLTVAYPVNLSPGSYIAGSQLSNDVQGFNAAYPSAGDPPEAILSSILQAILAKYPQMTGGALTALTGSSPVPGLTTPDGGAITVTIGKLGTLNGLFGAQPSKSAAVPVAK